MKITHEMRLQRKRQMDEVFFNMTADEMELTITSGRGNTGKIIITPQEAIDIGVMLIGEKLARGDYSDDSKENN